MNLLLRLLVMSALLMLGGLIGFAVPVLWVLDGRVQKAFNGLTWQEPTRVYARPLSLAVGEPLSAQTLVEELEAAAFRDDGEGLVPGSYAREGGRFVIATRGFSDIDGRQPRQRVEIRVGDGRIQQLRSLSGGDGRDVRLDPARIATLYGEALEERERVRLAELPPLLVTGLQAVEDRNFKHHHGVDPMGVLRAVVVNLREGGLEQGGSTLTQQLVRGLFLSNARTLERKLNEAAYALVIEARYDKQAILEAYLNSVYLGQQGNQSVRGIGAAARFWFGRDVRELRPHEIALLVGMVKGPPYYNPRRYPDRARQRRDLVLGVFADTGLLTVTDRDAARRQPLGVLPRPGLVQNRYPAFLALAQRQLASDYPADRLRGAGLAIHTTMSPSAQRAADAAADATLRAVRRPDGPELQAGVVLTDTRGGEVLAIVGARDAASAHGFNRALDARRPVGSLLKPFVYLMALAQPGRWSLASPVEDDPVEVVLPNGQRWRPGNSDGQSHGVVPLEDALVHSYNQATVRIGMEIGPERLVRLLDALAGIEAEPNPSLLLGAVDLSPLAMAQAYQFLASGGQVQPLRAVRGVLDAEGRPLSRYDEALAPAEEGDALAARLVTLALQQAARTGTARQLSTGSTAALAVAGKTGTSNDGRDSWFAGWTGRHLAVVWVGNDDNAPTGLYGATGAMRLWRGLFDNLPTSALVPGDTGIEWAMVAQGQYATTDAECPGARRYPFVTGFLPPEHLPCTERSLLDFFGF